MKSKEICLSNVHMAMNTVMMLKIPSAKAKNTFQNSLMVSVSLVTRETIEPAEVVS